MKHLSREVLGSLQETLFQKGFLRKILQGNFLEKSSLKPSKTFLEERNNRICAGSVSDFSGLQRSAAMSQRSFELTKSRRRK